MICAGLLEISLLLQPLQAALDKIKYLKCELQTAEARGFLLKDNQCIDLIMIFPPFYVNKQAYVAGW